MRKYFLYLISIISLSFMFTSASAEVIDAEQYIKKNGYQKRWLGSDGKTLHHQFTEWVSLSRISLLESDISKLSKHPGVLKFCNFMCSEIKNRLLEEKGITVDVTVSDYGDRDITAACVLKYKRDSNVGTQMIYATKSPSGQYMVIVTHE